MPIGLSVYGLAKLGGSLFAGTSPYGVLRSTDNGATWSATNSGLSNLSVNCMTVVNGVLLAGTQGGGVFRSTDNGDSWTGGGFQITLALSVLGTDLFRAGTSGIDRSTDAGLTWNTAN